MSNLTADARKAGGDGRFRLAFCLICATLSLPLAAQEGVKKIEGLPPAPVVATGIITRIEFFGNHVTQPHIMLQEMVVWFGENSTNTAVQVVYPTATAGLHSMTPTVLPTSSRQPTATQAVATWTPVHTATPELRAAYDGRLTEYGRSWLRHQCDLSSSAAKRLRLMRPEFSTAPSDTSIRFALSQSRSTFFSAVAA